MPSPVSVDYGPSSVKHLIPADVLPDKYEEILNRERKRGISMKKRGWVWLVASALVLTTTAFAVAGSADSEVQAAYVEKDGLPVVGSYENLKKLLEKDLQQQRMMFKTSIVMESAPVAGMAEAQSAPATANVTQTAAADYSTTNVQVQGVDEADVVKTDGQYIYQATSDEIRIVQANPADKMNLASRLSYPDGTFEPLELYVDQNRLVVIGQSYETLSVKSDSSPAAKRKIAPGFRDQHIQMLKARVYDIRDKQKPKMTRELEMEGRYLSSRKIGSSLYLVANHRINPYQIMEDQGNPAPAYRDQSPENQTELQKLPYDDIYYFPESLAPNYLMVAGVDLDKPNQKMTVHSYLGGGENMYASPENLYVAVSEYKNEIPNRSMPAIESSPAFLDETVDTTLYRFAMKDGSLKFSGKGSVPGNVLNQFSIDEHDGYLRIATTSGSIWRTDEGTSKNNLYVLDKDLKIHGKLEGIAPGEKIYSARFIGDRAYMVTFKTVDPLFVIDVKKPDAPRVLGALKIPGYSDYLHPYDENHLIGFGKEAEAEKDIAFYQGMKIALFDVTDVANPIEKFKTVIGDRGTDSELLSNHKALLFSKEKELLAFPVTVYSLSSEEKANRRIQDHGRFSFQGAYVYRLNLQEGFVLDSTITHLTAEDSLKAGHEWYNSEKNIRRILTIGDTLYTVSSSLIKSQKLEDHQPISTLSLTK